MFACRKKICICQKEIINWYMKAPRVKNQIFKDQLRFLEQKQKLCFIEMDTLEIPSTILNHQKRSDVQT